MICPSWDTVWAAQCNYTGKACRFIKHIEFGANMKQQITNAYTEIEKARRQMRGLSKACTAFGNLLGEEESWSLVGKAAMDCDEAMSKAQGKLDEMKARIYG